MTDVATRRKLHEQVMTAVLGDVMEGRYAEGALLPRELDLAAEHEVSRYVAREAIQALRDRGVVTVKHGVGATIAPVSDWHLLDVELLGAMLAGPQRRAVLAEAREARRLVWPEIAALAARRRRDADLTRLDDALRHRDELAFRTALLGAARNRFISHLVTALEGTVPETKAPTARGRAHVIAAIRAGDADAARAAMAGHVG